MKENLILIILTIAFTCVGISAVVLRWIPPIDPHSKINVTTLERRGN